MYGCAKIIQRHDFIASPIPIDVYYISFAKKENVNKKLLDRSTCGFLGVFFENNYNVAWQVRKLKNSRQKNHSMYQYRIEVHVKSLYQIIRQTQNIYSTILVELI